MLLYNISFITKISASQLKIFPSKSWLLLFLAPKSQIYLSTSQNKQSIDSAKLVGAPAFRFIFNKVNKTRITVSVIILRVFTRLFVANFGRNWHFKASAIQLIFSRNNRSENVTCENIPWTVPNASSGIGHVDGNVAIKYASRGL